MELQTDFKNIYLTKNKWRCRKPIRVGKILKQNNMKVKLFALLILSLIVTSCAIKIAPQRPNLGQTKPIIKNELSTIILPLTIEKGQIQSFINNEMPSDLYAGEIEGGDISIKREGNVEFTSEGNNLIFIVPLRAKAHSCKEVCIGVTHHGKCYGGTASKCGDGDASITLKIVASVNISSDYNIKVHSELFSQLNDAFLKFDVGPFNVSINIKDYVEGPVRKATEKFQGKLDDMIAKQLNKIDLKKAINNYWTKIGQPINVKNTLFLQIEPDSLLFQNIQSTSSDINIKVGIKGNISAVTSNPTTYSKPLPSLSLSSSVENKFSIYLPLYAEFDTISRQLNNLLSNKVYIDTVNKYEVQVKNIEIFGSGNSIVVGVDFKAKAKKIHKKAKGKLYFIAQPEFDIKNMVLKINEFNLTVESGNIINDKGLPWLAKNFYYDKIKEKLKYDLGKNITDLKTKLNEKLKEVKIDRLVINGEVTNLNFDGFAFDNKGIKIYVSCDGIVNTQPIKLE